MATIEVLAFGKLYFLFRERGWPASMTVEMDNASPTAHDLRKQLDIPAKDVEVVFINRLIKPLSTTLKTGDRVAFVPPGAPTIHRFNLGFYDVKEE